MGERFPWGEAWCPDLPGQIIKKEIDMQYIDLIVSILAGLVVCIPVVVRLGETIKTAVREKNWARIVDIAMDFMERAETMFMTGAERKQWVMEMVQAAAAQIDYDYDADAESKVSALVDDICRLSRNINAEG